MRRRTEPRLRRTFRDVLTAILATSAGVMAVAGASGCGGGSATTATTDPGSSGGGGGGITGPGAGGEMLPTPGFTSFCHGAALAPQRSFLQGLTATPALDGAVMRNESAFTRRNGPGTPGGITSPPMDERGDAWAATNGEQVGTMCATASNPSACRDKVAGFRVLPASRDACVAQYAASTYSSTECGASYILYTRGDEIGVALTTEQTKALIGTFDTIEEAMWVAQARGLQTSCGGNSFGGFGTMLPDSEYRQTADGGWDLSLIDNQNCGNATFKVLVHIDYAGNFTEVSRENLNLRPMCAYPGSR